MLKIYLVNLKVKKIFSLVIECPDEDWLKVIENSKDFDEHQQSESVKYIVHFTPKDIINNTRYKKWMEKFGTAQHLILNELNKSFTSEAIHRMQHQLHLIHPEIFPFLQEQNLIFSIENNKNDLNNNPSKV